MKGYLLDYPRWHAFVKVIHLCLNLKGEAISCFVGVSVAGPFATSFRALLFIFMVLISSR